MRSILIPLLLITAPSVNAQTHQWAVIGNTDTYIDIRQSPSATSPVADTIWENQFFVVEKKRGDWWRVWDQSIAPDGKGYIHKSRVRLINSLPDTAARRLLSQVISDYQTLLSLRYINYSERDRHPEKFTAADKAFLMETDREIAATYDKSYEPALRFLPRYFCRTNDSMTLKYFFHTMVADSSSNSEAPGNALGECYICQPEWFLNQLRKLPSPQRNIIFKQTQSGLANNINVAADKKAALAEMLKVEMVRR